VHAYPVDTYMPSAASLELAAAEWLVVNDDVGGGAVVRAHESPVATNIPIAASVWMAAAVWSVVHDDIASIK